MFFEAQLDPIKGVTSQNLERGYYGYVAAQYGRPLKSGPSLNVNSYC